MVISIVLAFVIVLAVFLCLLASARFGAWFGKNETVGSLIGVALVALVAVVLKHHPLPNIWPF
jgi:hypothetical protein